MGKFVIELVKRETHEEEKQALSSLGHARVLEIFPFPLKNLASSTQDVILTNSPLEGKSKRLGF